MSGDNQQTGSIFDDEIPDEIASSDSAILGVTESPRLLKVYEAGPVTVVGFGGKSVPADHNIADCRKEIIELIKKHDCKEFAFDLTGVSVLPSGMLGLISSIGKEGVRVAVYNACDYIREVFATTKLDRVVEIRSVEVE